MKYPSYCCQKCGELIGWIGRVLPFHKCKEKNMNPLPRYNEKGELDTRLRVDPVTGDVGIGTAKEFVTFYKPPEPVGYWCLYGGSPTTTFAMYQKPTDEQIKNTTELLGWIWKDAK